MSDERDYVSSIVYIGLAWASAMMFHQIIFRQVGYFRNNQIIFSLIASGRLTLLYAIFGSIIAWKISSPKELLEKNEEGDIDSDLISLSDDSMETTSKTNVVISEIPQQTANVYEGIGNDRINNYKIGYKEEIDNTNKTQSIEAIDFTGTGGNTLTLGYLDSLNLSETAFSGFSAGISAPKAIVIEGDAGDTLELDFDARGAWTAHGTDIGLDGTGTGFDIWSFDVAGSALVKLAVDHDVTVTLL